MYKVSPGCTGAMGSWTMGHLAYIANHGYEKWFEDMRKGREPEEPTEFDPEDQT